MFCQSTFVCGRWNNKRGIFVSRALGEIFSESRVSRSLRTDNRFWARDVQTILKNYVIKNLYAQNETKDAVTEHVFKAMKSNMYRFMTYQQSHEYKDSPQTFTGSYNNTIT